MALLHYLWSRVAASNATADSNVNWAEGQAPSSVNDSARAMMASAAGFRDDIAGAIVTGGTSTAYTVTSYQVFDTLAHMGGQTIAFTPHIINGATVTLNVDGLGAKPVRSSTGVEIPAGTLIAGTPYTVLYNNSDAVFYLHGFYGNPYNIPLGASIDYWGATAPNSSFVFPYGQAISQTTYATLYALFGSNKYGTDSGGNFILPDLRGRVIAGKNDMGGSGAGRLSSGYFGALSGLDGNSLGNTGGLESNTIVTGNLPAYTPAGTINEGSIAITGGTQGGTGSSTAAASGGPSLVQSPTAIVATQSGSTFSGTAQGGSSTPMRTVQPTIIANKILRVI